MLVAQAALQANSGTDMNAINPSFLLLIVEYETSDAAWWRYHS
jgi:hypothetical protein